MQKINGGSGKDIEVSEDIADSVDPESMLDGSIPEIKSNEKVSLDSIPGEQIIIITDFVSLEKEYKVTGLLKKISISNSSVEYEFFMLNKHLLFLLKIQKLEIHRIQLIFGDKEHEFNIGIRPIKKIEFESFGKQIKCHVSA